MLATNPTSSDTYEGLALSYFQLERNEETVSAAKRSLILNDDNLNVRHILAVAYAKLENDAMALATIRMLVETVPNYMDVVASDEVLKRYKSRA